jgi:hypothetical protein
MAKTRWKHLAHQAGRSFCSFYVTEYQPSDACRLFYEEVVVKILARGFRTPSRWTFRQLHSSRQLSSRATTITDVSSFTSWPLVITGANAHRVRFYHFAYDRNSMNSNKVN